MDVISDNVEPVSATTAPGAPNGAGGEPAPATLTQAVRWRPPVMAALRPASQARNPSLPTFCGLIILILTFFIVLTSISLHDQSKSDAAMASVQDAFSGNAVTTEEVFAQDEEAVARVYIAGLTDRIQSLVPLMGGKPAPAVDHQVLWLPTGLAFASESTTLVPGFPAILREVVKSLDGIPRRLIPHVEMRLCANEPSETLRKRALAIGAALSSVRAPMRQFAIGVAPCDPTRFGIAIALAPAREELAP
ncbi:MAG: flagellar motor protein MotB [Dongiaceae bacterium]